MGWMHRSARVFVSVLALLLLAAFAIVPGTARANMDRPTWASGDFWEYAVVSGTGPARTVGTLRMDVTGSESTIVNGTSYSAYHTTASLKEGLLTIPAEIWFSVDTLAIVKIASSFELIPGNASTLVQLSIAGTPPQTIHWPLTTGATWTDSTTVWATTTIQGKTNYTKSIVTTTFLVQAEQSVTVPKGTFTTTPLKETSANGTFAVNYWSAQVGNWAQIGEYDSNGRSQGQFNLTAYNYQGGSFFTSIIFGLPAWIWIILLVVILVAIIGFLAVRRRKPPVRAMPPPPPPMSPQEPMGPEGPPPGSMP